jgi:hypothetical protein
MNRKGSRNGASLGGHQTDKDERFRSMDSYSSNSHTPHDEMNRIRNRYWNL